MSQCDASACQDAECLGKKVREVTLASERFQDVMKKLGQSACEGFDTVRFLEPVSVNVEMELRARGFETSREDGKLVVSYTPETWVQNEFLHLNAVPYQPLHIATPV